MSSASSRTELHPRGRASSVARVAAAVAVVASVGWPRGAAAETVRFLVAVGNNAGGATDAPLRFAESDAEKFARVLVELGDVPSENVWLLQGRQAPDVEAAFGSLKERIDAARRLPEARVVVFFYFSGHSTGEAIELGGRALPYSRLRALLAGTGADLRLAVVDACRSGSTLRTKGGRPAEPFVIGMRDELYASGEAFLTSSAEDEASVELGEVGGGLFTHHLVTGLRGAADTSGDRLVSLNEAYRYAHAQTVAGTAMLPVSVQHPNYEYRLTGQGELAVTFLDRGSAWLKFPPGFQRGAVVDLRRDEVVAEVTSAVMVPVSVSPGTYGVRVFKGAQCFGGRVALGDGERRQLQWDDLRPIAASTASRKGPEVVASAPAPAAGHPELGASLVVTGGALPSLAALGLMPAARVAFEPKPRASLTFAVSAAHVGAANVSETAVDLRAGGRLGLRSGRLSLFGAIEAGPSLLWQGTGAGTAFSPAWVLAPRGGVRFDLHGPVALCLEGEAALALLRLDGRLRVAFRPQVGLGLALRF